MNDLKEILVRRFPLLSSLRICDSGGNPEDLASFMGILLATMAEPRFSSFCFVFPRQFGIAPLAAVLYAIGKFAVDFPHLAEEYARRSFEVGQRVKLNPDGKIFIFRGLWEGIENQFRLQIVNEERSTFTWPVTEILRIEPTQRKIPRGHFIDADLARKKTSVSTLDKLIGTKTFGNTSFVENHVLYLGARSGFEEFQTKTALTGAGSEGPVTIDEVISIGTIAESGAIKHEDRYKVAGEPFVAISPWIENIAAACSSAQNKSKVVIVDGASRITDLAKFDSIIETQNLIIVAEAEDEETLARLYDRGCRFWRFTLSDLEMGESRSERAPFFGPVFSAARNEARFQADVVKCENALLDKASEALETCQKVLDESEGDETRLLLRRLYAVLMRCTGLLHPPSDEDRRDLRTRMEQLSPGAQSRMMWLAEPAAKSLADACENLRLAVEDPELGKAKEAALKDLMAKLAKGNPERIAVVARTTAHKLSVKKWLEREGIHLPVIVPSEAREDGFFDVLVCTTWPNAANYKVLLSQHTAPLLYLTAYPFERRWLGSYNQRSLRSQGVPNINSSEKAELVGVSPEIQWAEPASDHSTVETGSESAFDFEKSITRKGFTRAAEPGEESIPARLASFVGDAYAFITENYRIPVITDLLSGPVGDGFTVPRRKVSEIRTGDVVVFRDGGKRDVIQALADAEIGPEAAQLRETAAQWHKALRDSGRDERSLLSELKAVKCERTQQTVRGWLADDSMIGPQDREDLEAIAYAIGDETLLKNVPTIWEAIRRLRSEHLSAGMRLSRILLKTLPQRTRELREGRTRIDIERAISAWIVQVESIEAEAEPRPRSQINTLLWDEDFIV
jgi:hypothetical protein